jgi:hypothetical protein
MTAAVPEKPAIRADADAYSAYVQRVADELILSVHQLERLRPLVQKTKVHRLSVGTPARGDPIQDDDPERRHDHRARERQHRAEGSRQGLL